jgi:ATP-dependent Lhr-like helicase
MPGDIFQLGLASYRIEKLESGKVYVTDAHGAPPTIPFWLGEGLGRTDELSASVGRLHSTIADLLDEHGAAAAVAWLRDTLGLDASAAEQLVEYLAAAKAALGALPSGKRVIFERFFDETGDTHLVIHSPFGSRVNRAWGLALRKRFCRRFNFELQAAALEDSIVISLGAVHSFALDEVARYLTSATVRDVLTQAVLAAPVFGTYWRWNSTVALAVRRFRNGKKAPAQFQRMDAEDLLATVFPDQLACAENLPGGDREIPDHPLVAQTLDDCLTGAMDVDGAARLLARIEAGDVEVLCRELTSPSPLAQEILGAKPYAFLDDAPAEERRTLAVQTRRFMSPEQAAELGKLDPDAIARVRAEAWPQAATADELHDALALLGVVAEAEADLSWHALFAELRATRRATTVELRGLGAAWVGAERLAEVLLALPGAVPADRLAALDGAPQDPDAALRELVRSRLEALGPVTADALARPLGSSGRDVLPALAALEQQGVAMRGSFTGESAGEEEWCERRLLARIHRYTLKRLRSEIEPATLAEFQRFLFHWQGLGADAREGREALGAVIGELQGVALPAALWEREVLPARISDYGAALLDQLCAAGEVVWWRPRPNGAPPPGRATTVATSPIAIVPRAALAHWRALGSAEATRDGLSGAAARVAAALEERGASFFVEIVQASGLLRVQVEDALGELVARGLVTADSFHGLRAVLTPQSRRRGFRGRGRLRGAAAFDAAGRWALLGRPSDASAVRAEAIEHAAKALLRRYGVICRALLAREPIAPAWRELLPVYRGAEARGEIRGGRFVEPLGGEQFALLEAVEELRRVRRAQGASEWLALSVADPLNLASVVGDPARAAVAPSRRLVFRNGAVVAAEGAGGIEWRVELGPAEQRRVAELLADGRSAPPPQSAYRSRFR